MHEVVHLEVDGEPVRGAHDLARHTAGAARVDVAGRRAVEPPVIGVAELEVGDAAAGRRRGVAVEGVPVLARRVAEGVAGDQVVAQVRQAAGLEFGQHAGRGFGALRVAAQDERASRVLEYPVDGPLDTGVHRLPV